MRTLRIDFTSKNILPDGCIAGRIGEHNATTLVIAPPSEITACESASNLCIAFFTGVGIIHSEVMPKAEKLQIPLWKQLTQYSTLAVQLEAYDDNGGLIVKSSVISLKLLPSLCGKFVEADTENPDLTAQVAQNSKSRHTHSNQQYVLDKFGLNYAGNRPTFNGGSNILAFQEDILDRLKGYALKSIVPNSATIDGSKLKMQRNDGMSQTILFDVDLPVSGTERPTATVETTDEGTLGIEIWQDFPYSDGFSVICNDSAIIPIGAEIKTIEFKIGSDGEWLDIHRLYELDCLPYYLNMNRAFDFEGTEILACIFKTVFGENTLHMAVINGETIKIRVTYYTDNIGGESNA